MQLLEYVTLHQFIFLATLYRLDHDILFEELRTMEKITDPTAIVLEKDSKL